ncbi:hypothetical protein LUZ61_006502 [Rhynchospora tenuis]|uniref:Glycosyltransferase n=1 Tax=Rhynchospora tenuis TaxID=198213 RepID=A0AAD5ZRL4_9POAL|nr:hypothetical protein LUZ61_006502 [Rhynchospora tenuis]
MSSPPHALVLPWPRPGHIIPLMHLSHFLADNGFKISFVNTDDSHNRIVSSGAYDDRFHIISIPDGLGPDEKRLTYRLVDAIEHNMPSQLENLIRNMNEKEDTKITCLIADGAMSWAVEVAHTMGLRSVVFQTTSASFVATCLSIPKLRQTGLIDENGKVTNPRGHFCSVDPSCMSWLDQQPVNSVIYVAFGSIETLGRNQLEEIAFGLDSSQMPFLWVIRTDETMIEHHDFLKQFQESIRGRGWGKLVNWCNQERVLAHPSIACFVSHCGWNSTMDGVKNGVPFLCLPLNSDQFAVRSYLCDEVKIGLSLVRNENGVVTREEIRSKLVELLQSEEIKERAERMKELAQRSISPRGSSFQNLHNLVEALKKTDNVID